MEQTGVGGQHHGASHGRGCRDHPAHCAPGTGLPRRGPGDGPTHFGPSPGPRYQRARACSPWAQRGLRAALLAAGTAVNCAGQLSAKNAVMSRATSSGSWAGAKCPPLGITVQRRMTPMACGVRRCRPHPTNSCQLRLALRGDDVAEQPVGLVVGPGGEVQGVGGDVEGAGREPEPPQPGDGDRGAVGS